MNRIQLEKLREETLQQMIELNGATDCENWLNLSLKEVGDIFNGYTAKVLRCIKTLNNPQATEEEYDEACDGFANTESGCVGYMEIMHNDANIAELAMAYVEEREKVEKEEKAEAEARKTAEAYRAKKETKTFRKFKLGYISDVYVSKVKGGYNVSVCGNYEGKDYAEADNIVVKNEDVNFKAMASSKTSDKYEIAARLGFFFLDFADEF